MDVRIISLELTNFKGTKSFVFEANGEDVSVRGDNGTGKSTLADAWHWLLTGKDSLGSADFEIKTLTPSGEALHGLDHSVQAVVDADGHRMKLRRTWSERWVKARGSATRVHDGHTTDHYIDDVPVKAGEYKSRIAEIAPEDDAQLLTNPAYFASSLHWTKRREALIALCGDVADSEVIATDKALEAIPAILDGKTIDERRKIIAQSLSGLNKKIAELPTRIDEVSRSMPEAVDTAADLEGLRAERTRLSEELTRITAGGEVAEQRAKLSSAEGRVIDITNEWRKKSGEGAEKQTADIDAARREVNRLAADLSAINSDIDRLKEEAARSGAESESHKDKWREINAETFTPSAADTCPTCSQSLPAEQVDAANAKAVSIFNGDKAARLTSVKALGMSAADRQVSTLAAIESKAQLAVSARDELTIAEARLESLDTPAPTTEAAPLDRFPGYKEAIAARDMRQAEIDKLTTDSDAVASAIREELRGQDAAIAEAEAVNATQRQREAVLERIQTLMDEERELAAKYEELEGHKFLTEEFVKAKVALLEGRINERFEITEWKLFDLQVNGAVSECCEATLHGVPWNSLNSAGRTQVGCDTIRTLSRAKKLLLPVIIDNRESVVRLPDMDCQVISLVVDEREKTLKVERQLQALSA